jgi:hypothetical protein
VIAIGASRNFQVFLRVAKGLLAIEQRDVGARRARFDRLQIFQDDLRLLHPIGIGIGGGQLVLDVFIGNDALAVQIDEQHLARLEAPFFDDFFFRHVQRSGLGRHQDVAIVCDEIARRAQAVAVKRCADHPAIGEGDRCWAVPWLHQRGVVLVERLAVLIHHLVAGPGFGHQHHDGVVHRVAAHEQEFQGIVEASRVRLTFIGDRPELGDVVAKKLGVHRRLAGGHPVDVAAQRVDLTIVRHHPVGVGELPGREGVGGETLMHQGERGGEALVRQVLEIGAQLVGQEHALVDDRARGQRDDVELLAGGDAAIDRVGDDLAQDEEPAFEIIAARRGFAAGDEDLTVDRLGGLDVGRLGEA